MIVILLNMSQATTSKRPRSNGARFPHLIMLAKKCLAIPGSSVPSECLFSKAGELISEKRSQLTQTKERGYYFVFEQELEESTLTSV